MSKSELPERPSLEFLKRRAKDRLVELRASDPRSKLAAAQLAIAREYGFASWRALKLEVDRRREPLVARFFASCAGNDMVALRELLAREPSLVGERRDGASCLHVAVSHVEAVRLLLAHGADPNARDDADHAYALHRANDLEVMRALLDAGGDVHGVGDAHKLDVIGWHTCYPPVIDRAALALLLERGARHHVFSATACGDHDALEALVEHTPAALARRLAAYENRQTVLHYVVAPPDGLIGGGFRTGAHYATLDLLLELGADLENEDDRGRTPLALAMLRGDHEAAQRLRDAGARVPAPRDRTGGLDLATLARTVRRVDAMLRVPNVRATIDWYRALGFELTGEHALDTPAAWARVSLGDSHVMLVPGGTASAPRETSLWFRTDRVDELHHVLKQRQLDRAAAVLAGHAPLYPEARFAADLHDTFYGEREFTLVDLNGYELTFGRSSR